jgi:hypothetical protein
MNYFNFVIKLSSIQIKFVPQVLAPWRPRILPSLAVNLRLQYLNLPRVFGLAILPHLLS